jgi:hypothetical protein
MALLSGSLALRAQAPAAAAPTEGQVLPVASAGFPVEIMVESPDKTKAELQVICLFRTDTAVPLFGSLIVLDNKLGGALTKLRAGGLFRGELGETILLVPKPGTISASRLLIVGLGDLAGFVPAREQRVGWTVFQESARLGVAHPYFAPTVLDGGKKGMDTGQVSENFWLGFLRAKAAEDALRAVGASAGPGPSSLTFLAGGPYATTAQAGLARASAAGAGK